MRKHHNKLFFGKYTHKAVFKVPEVNRLYPTSDYYLKKIIDKFIANKSLVDLGQFLIDNRKKCKFRIQNNCCILYANKDVTIKAIDKLWDTWVGITTVDMKNIKIMENNTVVCRRLPLGKYKYQVYVNRNMWDKISNLQRDQLYNYLTRNTENATITNKNLKQWLSGNGAIHYDLTGYFYVKDEKSLLPVYMISENIVGQIRKFVKV